MGKSGYDGFETDGCSDNTFGPSVKSTPNKVGADDFSPKKGKGNITGGIWEGGIFSSINYTAISEDAAKPDFKSVDKGVWSGIDYSTDTEGMPGKENNGVFGSPSYAARDKNAKVNGAI